MEVIRYLRTAVWLAELCLVAAALTCGSCGKIDLDAYDENTDATVGKPGTEVAPRDTAAIAARAVTVDVALRLPAGTEVAVRGYVVGYVAGTSLSAAFFGAPEDKQNTNMLIACRANEAYSEDCLPVRLVTTGQIRAQRSTCMTIRSISAAR